MTRIVTEIPSSFDDQLLAEVNLVFSSGELEVFHNANEFRKAGLKCCRNQEFAEAKRHFCDARRCIKSERISRVCSFLCCSFLNSSEAYLYYCLGDYNRSRQYLLSAFLEDTVICEQQSFEIVHLHRIQLVHNEVRIRYKEAETFAGTELAISVILHTLGLGPLACFGQNVSFECIEKLPRSFLEQMRLQISRECALRLMDSGSAIAAKAVRAGFGSVNREYFGMPEDCSCLWWDALAAFYCIEAENGIADIHRFFAHNNCDPILLFSLTSLLLDSLGVNNSRVNTRGTQLVDLNDLAATATDLLDATRAAAALFQNRS